MESIIKEEPHDVDFLLDEYVQAKRKQITQQGDEELDPMAALLTPEVTLEEEPPDPRKTFRPGCSSPTERRQPTSFQFVDVKKEPAPWSSGSEDECPDPFQAHGKEVAVDKEGLVTAHCGEFSLGDTGSPSPHVTPTRDTANVLGDPAAAPSEGNAGEPTKRHRVRGASKSYPCDLCTKLFTRKDTLVTHYRTHTGEKPFGCDVCGRRFSVHSSLTSHRRTHTGEKPYRCKVCLKEFNRSSSLSTHSRMHTGAKPYRCKVCRKQFSHASSFTTHGRTHTGDKPYRCKVCGKQFSDSSNLISHNRTHATDKLFIARFSE